jgi:hypothetical protein
VTRRSFHHPQREYFIRYPHLDVKFAALQMKNSRR